MTTPLSYPISGEVAKLRLIRGINPPPTELCFDDPYVIKDVMSFTMDSTPFMEAVSEIDKRSMDYVPSPSCVHGWFECFFQQEDKNTITDDLLSLRFDNEEGERFYADVHYEDGHHLTACILITNRSYRSNNKLKFNFLCTDLLDYENLALRNIPPSPPQNLTSEIDRDTNYVTLTFDNAGADNSLVTGYAARYRTVFSNGVKNRWSPYAGTISDSGTTKQTTTSDVTNTFGATAKASEIQVYAISDVGKSAYSEILFIGACPIVTVAGAKGSANVIITAYKIAFFGSRTVTRYDYEYRVNTATDWSTATAGTLTTVTPTHVISSMTAGDYDFRIRGVLSDGSYTYWYMTNDVTIS